jgi:malic enzyme
MHDDQHGKQDLICSTSLNALAGKEVQDTKIISGAGSAALHNP